MPAMRRRATAAGLGGFIVAVLLVGVLAAKGLAPGSGPTPTPVITVVPVSTPTKPVNHHHVTLTADFKRFVHEVCAAFQRGDASFLETHLEFYQYNTEVYYSPFNLSSGFWALPGQLQPWTGGGSVRCVRMAEPYSIHGVLVTRGWSLDGGWGIIDMDIPPGRTSFRLNDFEFGSKAQVMGAFYGSNPESLPYRSRVKGNADS